MSEARAADPTPGVRVGARNRALLGYEVTERGDGVVVARWVPTEAVGNPAGFVHGGFVAVIVDELGGTAIASALRGRTVFPTVSMHIDYIRGVRLAVPHEVTARVVRLGRAVSFAEVEVRSLEGALCSRGQCTFALALPEGERLGFTRV